MTSWQKKYNRHWPTVLSKEATDRILKAGESNQLILSNGQVLGIADRMVMQLTRQEPLYLMQLYFETREALFNLMEEKNGANL